MTSAVPVCACLPGLLPPHLSFLFLSLETWNFAGSNAENTVAVPPSRQAVVIQKVSSIMSPGGSTLSTLARVTVRLPVEAVI